jgi:hypothetical protein
VDEATGLPAGVRLACQRRITDSREEDPVKTDCSGIQLEFEGLGRRQVVADFTGGHVTSDGGVLLVREVAERTGLLRRFAGCFEDYRNQDLIEHTVQELVSQRVIGLACGYEDLNDHDRLRDDPLLAAAAGKTDPSGEKRPRERDRGHGGAGKSTLNRLELTPQQVDSSARYKKIRYQAEAIERWFVEAFLAAHAEPLEEIVLDLDATDDPLHGHQEGRFFHGYYRCYCYLPLYITCGDFVLVAKLRRSDIDASAGAVEELERVVGQIRRAWPTVRITVRGDSGFAREELMGWCEAQGVDFVLGLAKNTRLIAAIEPELEEVRVRHEQSGEPERAYKEFRYRTRETWSRERRVVGKAEQIPGKSNPRFVVTSLTQEAKVLYEQIYCARGDMENRIKEQQLDLFADRTSAATMRANQLRLWFSTAAYVLMNEVRRVGLRGTQLARAQAGTIRTRLLKIGGLVKVSVRRVYLALSTAFPLQELFEAALHNIQGAYPLRI